MFNPQNWVYWMVYVKMKATTKKQRDDESSANDAAVDSVNVDFSEWRLVKRGFSIVHWLNSSDPTSSLNFKMIWRFQVES